MWKNVDFEGRSVKVLFGTWLVVLYSCLVTAESQSRLCGRGLSISLKLVSSHIHLSSWGRIHWFWMPDFYRNSFVLVCRFWLLNRFKNSHDQLRSYCKRQGKKKTTLLWVLFRKSIQTLEASVRRNYSSSLLWLLSC